MTVRDTITLKKDENDQYIAAGHIKTTIDGETNDIIIKEIDKLSTQLFINNLNHTAFQNDIKGTLSLQDILGNTIKGVITLTLWDKDKKTQYYQKDITVDNDTPFSIPNTLAVDAYTLVVEYNGNKYYQPTSSEKTFNIEKRVAYCTFNKNQYYTYPNTTLDIEVTLRDKENNDYIEYSEISYSFNDEMQSAITNRYGTATLTLDIPKTDKTHCHGTENMKYKCIVSFENNSYSLDKNNYTYIIVIKLDTKLQMNGRDELVEGSVSIDDGYVNHGEVELNFNDYYTDVAEVDEYGRFQKYIHIPSVINGLSSEYDGIEDASRQINTTLTLSAVETEINAGEEMTVEATVIGDDNQNVLYGTIDFRLFNSDEKQIYRYVTRVNDVGSATFIFYTSKKDKYRIEAHYESVVTYNSSTNNKDIIIDVV